MRDCVADADTVTLSVRQVDLNLSQNQGHAVIIAGNTLQMPEFSQALQSDLERQAVSLWPWKIQLTGGIQRSFLP